MPDSFVSLLTDNKTKKSFNENNRQEILKIIDEIITVDFPDNTNNKYKARWLKTSMRKHIEGDFLFIDCDTVITEKLIFKTNIVVGAVQDIHLSLHKRFKNNDYMEFHTQRDKKCGFTTSEYSYYNSGVIYCKDTIECHSFFEKWHSLWLSGYEKGVTEDQPSFSMANITCNNIITEIDGTWNCQLVNSGKLYLPNAKIIHYYNSEDNKKNYLFAKKNVYDSIKKEGNIPLEYKKILMKPRAAFYFNNNKKFISFSNKLFYIVLSFLFSKPVNYLFKIITYIEE